MFPNKFPKNCAKCSRQVPALVGVCHKVNDKWIVEHSECYSGPAQKVEKLTEKLEAPEMSEENWESLISTYDKFTLG